jgi:hypothetical protein
MGERNLEFAQQWLEKARQGRERRAGDTENRRGLPRRYGLKRARNTQRLIDSRGDLPVQVCSKEGQRSD